jgi:hypothetical protein
MNLIQCTGTVVTGSAGEAICVDGGGLPLAWEAWDWSLVGLDPATASVAFGAGVFIALAFWVAASGIVLLVRSLGSFIR